jgi:hypothetical protein
MVGVAMSYEEQQNLYTTESAKHFQNPLSYFGVDPKTEHSLAVIWEKFKNLIEGFIVYDKGNTGLISPEEVLILVKLFGLAKKCLPSLQKIFATLPKDDESGRFEFARVVKGLQVRKEAANS